MKKAVLLFLLAATFYIAGMYRYRPLMVLFFAELFIGGATYVQARYLKKNLLIEIPRKSDSAQKESILWCVITAKNKGRLPVSRFRLRLRFGYPQDGRSRTKMIYGGSDCGDYPLRFGMYAQYCGPVRFRMDHLKVYDYLTLFGAKKSFREEMTIAVFPVEKALRLELGGLSGRAGSVTYGNQTQRKGDNPGEIRQIREYRAGDSTRHIHWNQSAKTGRYWVKEYEKETDRQICLYVDIRGNDRIKRKKLSAFYELLSAFVIGALEQGACVRAYWQDGQNNRLMNLDVTDRGGCRDLLLSLYRLEDEGKKGQHARNEEKKALGISENCFRIDSDLNLYLNEILIRQFSVQNLDREILQHVIAV